jgi:AraC-like DNA-binding protein
MPFEIGRIEELPSIAQTAQPHRHSFYELIWVAQGAGYHHIDFEPYPIQAQTLYFISPGQVHFWQIEQPLQGYMLLFTDEFLLSNTYEPITPRSFDFFHRLDHIPMLTLLGAVGQPFATLCQQMLDEYRGQAFGRLTMLQAHLQMLLIVAQRHYTQASVAKPLSSSVRLVDEYIRLIDVHVQEYQQVHEYASRLGVTPGHLTDTTREVTGMAAGQFIYRRMMLEAKRLLVYSDQSISEIAYGLNFSDPSYFTRFFRRECGTSPTQFRANTRKKYQSLRNSSL